MDGQDKLNTTSPPINFADQVLDGGARLASKKIKPGKSKAVSKKQMEINQNYGVSPRDKIKINRKLN